MLFASALCAAAQAAVADDSGKFDIQGSTLVYDTEAARLGPAREIQNRDVDVLRDLLRANPGIRTLKLNSTGGSVWAGIEMAHIVQDFELNTVTDGACSSACVTVFLAGARRTMTRGSKIGFHQRSWNADAMADYYESVREEEGWETPFDFGSWVYSDTQTETFEELRYMIGRGVDPVFAIETKRMRGDLWFPSRAELEEAGVLVE
ncbi:ATP-dependent Clp protease proteolytic subunit [Cognatishimia sp. F0-27]|nr:ATP-dependent Clp protease proteolytic subunit [Cognatishimia sp. F0-27]